MASSVHACGLLLNAAEEDDDGRGTGIGTVLGGGLHAESMVIPKITMPVLQIRLITVHMIHVSADG